MKTRQPRKVTKEKNSRGRTNRTLSLNLELFLEFKSLCAKAGKTASEAVEELIEAYVQQAKKKG